MGSEMCIRDSPRVACSEFRVQCGDHIHINIYLTKVPTMVGFWEKSRKSDQMPYFGQKLVGFLGLQRNLEEFSRNSGIYLHDNV